MKLWAHESPNSSPTAHGPAVTSRIHWARSAWSGLSIDFRIHGADKSIWGYGRILGFFSRLQGP